MIAAAFVTTLATAALIAATYQDDARARAWLKVVAVAGFLAHAWLAGAPGTRPGRVICLGLVFAAAGDLFLISRGKMMFLAGLLSFLMGHLFYAYAFVTMGIDLGVTLAASIVLGGVGLAVHRWLAPHVGSLGKPVIAYIVVIVSMVAFAAGAVSHRPGVATVGLGLSSVAFFLSDLGVARDRFIAPGPLNSLVGSPLYFGAQLGFGFFAGLL